MTHRRTCTLLRGIHIERAAAADWTALADLHYRGHRVGAATDFFRMVYIPPAASQRGGRAGALEASHRRVGVIVYSRSPLSLAGRNRATGGRYRLGRLARTSPATLVNRELRIISRVVIAPNWRGLGLASRLVAETLTKVGTPYVEAMAAMGRMHPFFERAGMTAYPGAPSAGGERLRACLEAAGIGAAVIRSPTRLTDAIAKLPDALRRLVENETARWARSYLGAKNHKTNRPGPARLADLVARHFGPTPVYYLWSRTSR